MQEFAEVKNNIGLVFVNLTYVHAIQTVFPGSISGTSISEKGVKA